MVVVDDAPFIPVEPTVETEVPVEEEVATETGIVTEVTTVPEVVEVKAEILSLLDKVLLKYRYKEAPKIATYINERMLEYVNSMTGNRPIDAGAGATHQVNLYYTILMALEQETVNDSLLCLDIILSHISNNISDCFSDRLVYRFFSNMNIDAKKRAGFEKIMYMLLNISDTTKRRAFLARMDVNRILEQMPSELCKRNLLTFISI
jgi:hypothetical protein